MNKRIKRKIEKRRREKILQIFDLALQINGLDVRKRETTGKLPTVFAYFSGHVATVEISIHSNGWCAEVSPDKEYSFYTDREDFERKAGGVLRSLSRILNSVEV